MPRFPGVYVAIVTPFTPSLDLDRHRLSAHVNWLIEQGVHGLVPMGTCGEYASLSDEERAAAVETVIASARGRVPVVVGVSSPSTARALHWARHAALHGADGVMSLPAAVNYHPTRSEVHAYYQALSEVGLPILIYNNAHDTGTDLTPEWLNDLAQIPQVVAVKEFSGDIRRIHAILSETPLEVMAGEDDLVYEAVLSGATGWVAGLTNAVPDSSVLLFRLLTEGRIAEAQVLYRRLLPLFRYDASPQLVQAIKCAMDATGQPVGPTRPPRLPLDADRQAHIRALVSELKG